MTTGEGLLDITLSDGKNTITYSTSNNPSKEDKPIELPVANQSLANVKMALPAPKSSITLNELVSSPYSYWGDDNGDGGGEQGVTATGNLSLTITDVWGKSIDRSARLSVCNSPYKVILSTTAGSLTTQYGTPNSTDITAASETYYIRPKVGNPVACWAQPNLDYSSTHLNPLAPSNPHFNFFQLDGPASQWDPDKGFLPQSRTNPAANFPTMGAHGLFFDLVLGDKRDKRIYIRKSPTDSGINMSTTINGNIIRVTLTGPRNGASPVQAQTAVPTRFDISYKEGKNYIILYTFTISKWFIAKPGNAGPYDVNYCRNTYGDSYRFPTINEYTNGNSPDQGWTGGLSGQAANYQRRIGGGLFAEWGNMDNFGRWGNKSIYQQSDFDDVWYWTSNKYSETEGYYVDSYGGWMFHAPYVNYGYRFACVTP